MKVLRIGTASVDAFKPRTFAVGTADGRASQENQNSVFSSAQSIGN